MKLTGQIKNVHQGLSKLLTGNTAPQSLLQPGRLALTNQAAASRAPKRFEDHSSDIFSEPYQGWVCKGQMEWLHSCPFPLLAASAACSLPCCSPSVCYKSKPGSPSSQPRSLHHFCSLPLCVEEPGPMCQPAGQLTNHKHNWPEH